MINQHNLKNNMKFNFSNFSYNVSELEFKPNISRIIVELEILHDDEREHREAFTLHLKNDRKMVADVKVS